MDLSSNLFQIALRDGMSFVLSLRPKIVVPLTTTPDFDLPVPLQSTEFNEECPQAQSPTQSPIPPPSRIPPASASDESGDIHSLIRKFLFFILM